MSRFESTFSGRELFDLLHPSVQDAFKSNTIRQNTLPFFSFVLERTDYVSMDEFLNCAFLFRKASPSSQFWFSISTYYSEKEELMAFSELTLI